MGASANGTESSSTAGRAFIGGVPDEAGPFELDPSNVEHRAAVHEAAHAVAADRQGCLLTHSYLIDVGGTRSDGDTQRLLPADTTAAVVYAVDRVIAAAGPAAELRFAGVIDEQACQHDWEVIQESNGYLGDDGAGVEAAVAMALLDEDTWLVVRAVACTLLDSLAGVGPAPQVLHGGIATLLGPVNPPWPSSVT